MDIDIVIEQDEDGGYIGEAPQLRGAYAQGDTLDELMANMREVIALCLEEAHETAQALPKFVGIQRLTVPA